MQRPALDPLQTRFLWLFGTCPPVANIWRPANRALQDIMPEDRAGTRYVTSCKHELSTYNLGGISRGLVPRLLRTEYGATYRIHDDVVGKAGLQNSHTGQMPTLEFLLPGMLVGEPSR